MGLLPAAGPAYSKLDEAGVEKIKADKRAVLDLRSGKLTAGVSGLESTSATVEVPEGLDLTIVMPKGSVDVKTTRLKYTTSNEHLGNKITYEVRADSNDAYFALLNDGTKDYGIPSYPVSQWIRAIKGTPDFDDATDLGVGYSTGLAMRYETAYDGPDGALFLGVTVTEMPVTAPAAATPLGSMGSEKDPMSQYVESITTPEEKVARLRAYTALPEILNAASPAHETPSSVYQDLFEKDIITAGFLAQNKDQTEWGTGQYPGRSAGYTYQVTGMYCPMHEQTLVVLDRGFLSCSFTGQNMLEGFPVNKHTVEEETGWKTPTPDEIRQAKVYMKKDGDTWRVDNIRLE